MRIHIPAKVEYVCDICGNKYHEHPGNLLPVMGSGGELRLQQHKEHNTLVADLCEGCTKRVRKVLVGMMPKKGVKK